MNQKTIDGGMDIQSIISSLAPDPQKENPAKETGASSNELKEGDCRLWTEFMDCLNDTDDGIENSGGKRYAIDDDIVATLHQCDFGKPNVEVINSILRVFLCDNISHLKDLSRPKVISLLDKFR